ncbi:hypothetical protein BJY04DRAFT_219691 [Aspergillus karnatakaensis]|uniref:uncharacterized protein n=1 Tax=Aspergillus karnatakaensis TaxID=1810916 RepID=UPI003CCCA9EA
MSTESDVVPPWGALPVEQHLIREWKYKSNLTDSEPRRAIVQDFLRMSPIPGDYDGTERQCPIVAHTPNQRGIDIILAPWRSQQLRQIALDIWVKGPGHAVPVVRTYYTPHVPGQALNESWATKIHSYCDEFHEKRLAGRVLDDPTVFNFGNDWRAVFDIHSPRAGRSSVRALPRR